MKLAVNVLLKFLSGLLALGLLLFIPAGTLRYPGAWRLIIILFVPMFLFGLVLLLKKPELLEKRLKAKESENEQKMVILLSSLEFIACFVLSGLDFRFGWSHFPNWLIVAACIIFLASYGLYAEVTRENAYLSRTVEIQENQQVVSTGLYGIVRHPMYFAVTLLFCSMPLVLGSLPAFIVMLPLPLILVKRIKNEEEVLQNGLPGYSEYKKKVKYRLIPFIW